MVEERDFRLYIHSHLFFSFYINGESKWWWFLLGIEPWSPIVTLSVPYVCQRASLTSLVKGLSNRNWPRLQHSYLGCNLLDIVDSLSRSSNRLFTSSTDLSSESDMAVIADIFMTFCLYHLCQMQAHGILRSGNKAAHRLAHFDTISPIPCECVDCNAGFFQLSF